MINNCHTCISLHPATAIATTCPTTACPVKLQLHLRRVAHVSLHLCVSSKSLPSPTLESRGKSFSKCFVFVNGCLKQHCLSCVNCQVPPYPEITMDIYISFNDHSLIVTSTTILAAVLKLHFAVVNSTSCTSIEDVVCPAFTAKSSIMATFFLACKPIIF
jgi:hypothetical protein